MEEDLQLRCGMADLRIEEHALQGEQLLFPLGTAWRFRGTIGHA
jgi:hypothetical protein